MPEVTGRMWGLILKFCCVSPPLPTSTQIRGEAGRAPQFFAPSRNLPQFCRKVFCLSTFRACRCRSPVQENGREHICVWQSTPTPSSRSVVQRASSVPHPWSGSALRGA